jgi:hypothetical protein
VTPATEIDSAHWTYENETDEFTGESVRSARLKSINTFELQFPYAGAQHAVLTVQTLRSGKDRVVVGVEHGQFMPEDGQYFILRAIFDDRGPIEFPAEGSKDGRTTEAWILPTDRFMTQMRTANRMKMQATFFQQGTRTFQFDVSDFDMERLHRMH